MMGTLSGWAGESVAQVMVHPERPGPAIPEDFLGVSCEKSVLADHHFRPDNTELINLFRNLGPGILRPGGARVETTYWSPTEVNPSANTKKRKTIGPSDLDQLYGFSKASGWRVLHGLNLGANDPAMAADEARYAFSAGGESVLALEIGNEPDQYVRLKLRPENYEYPQYRAEVEAYQRAILAKIPHAPLAGPATTRASKWFFDFVADFKDRLTVTTSHYYPLSAKVENPNESRFASIPHLLDPKTDAVWMSMIEEHQKAAHAAGLRFRLGECNSASGGGMDGVSNVFASALWGSDFLFEMAGWGLAGINFHGYFEDRGYTPFCLRDGHYVPHPIYYAMLLFHQAGRGRIVPVECQAQVNLTAHAVLGNGGKLRIALINKDLARPVIASVECGPQHEKGELIRLTAPSATSKDGVTLAAAAVAANGEWTPKPGEPVSRTGGKFAVSLPAASAGLLLLG